MLDLVDVWRVKTSQSRRYTWSQQSQLIFCRLDYWLISNNLQDFVNTTDILGTMPILFSKTYYENLQHVYEEAKKNKNKTKQKTAGPFRL